MWVGQQSTVNSQLLTSSECWA